MRRAIKPAMDCAQLTAAAATAALLVAAAPAAAQGTWVHTGCLVGAGASAALATASATPAQAAAAGPAASAAAGPDAAPPAAPACKATPAWGQSGLDHVQSLALAAGPGNLGISLVKAQTLPAANAARSQLSTVMLAYLDGELPATAYRWFGPVSGNPLTAAKAISAPAAASGPQAATARVTSSATPGAAPAVSPPVILNPVQSSWRLSAWGDEPQASSASWWLASPFLGLPGPVATAALPSAGPGRRYAVLHFLAAQCPQLEGKVAPNAWTRCTTLEVPEPGSWVLVGTALALAVMAGRKRRR